MTIMNLILRIGFLRSPHRTDRVRSALPALALAGGLCAGLLFGLSGCGDGAEETGATFSLSGDETAFIDTLQAHTFRYFWELCNPQTGLAPDRAPTPSFASIGATGFALTSYPIGVERGYISREDAVERVLLTLRFLRDAPQNADPSGAAGFHGFYYHFVVPETGARFGTVELSTVDTALLLAGALFCQSYFDGGTAGEDSIRAIAEELY
ncbi:MAG: hypothetical protein E4H48_05460, partial [Syntrophobacterales bacterium]